MSEPELVDATLVAQRLNSRNIKLVRDPLDCGGHGGPVINDNTIVPEHESPTILSTSRGGEVEAKRVLRELAALHGGCGALLQPGRDKIGAPRGLVGLNKRQNGSTLNDKSTKKTSQQNTENSSSR